MQLFDDAEQQSASELRVSGPRGLAALARHLAENPDVAERFGSKIWRAPIDDECHWWLGALSGDTAHGKMHLMYEADGRAWVEGAHRIAWVLANDPARLANHPPIDNTIRHTCDEPPCCNQTHLELGTQAENVEDWRQRRLHTDGPFDDVRGIVGRARAIQHAILTTDGGPWTQLAAVNRARDGGNPAQLRMDITAW